VVSSKETSTETDSSPKDAGEMISRLKSEVLLAGLVGDAWKLAVLETIALWPTAQEQIGDDLYVYLIGGEAFDWQLLAKRLLRECEADIDQEVWWDWLSAPVLFAGFEEADFMRAVGVDKGRAHLSYFYGVTVEQSLVTAVEEEVTHRRVGAGRPLSDHSLELAYEMLYGNTRDQLWEVFKLEAGTLSARDGWRHRDEHTLGSEDAFTYWLFKLRMERSDPAKIASDTRKGLAKLERMRQNDVRRRKLVHADAMHRQMSKKSRPARKAPAES
jgi:hypothetical protein